MGFITLAGCGGGNGGCNNCETITTHVTVNGMSQLDGNAPVNGDQAFSIENNCNFNASGNSHFSGTTDSKNASYVANNVENGGGCPWAINRGTTAKCPVGNGIQVFFSGPGGSYPIDCGVQVKTFMANPNLIDPRNSTGAAPFTRFQMTPSCCRDPTYGA